MVRCVRLLTGSDDVSHVQVGRLDMAPGRNADLVSTAISASHVIEETATGGSLAWHTAPVRQLVVTLADPWRRMYVVLAQGADVPFVAD